MADIPFGDQALHPMHLCNNTVSAGVAMRQVNGDLQVRLLDIKNDIPLIKSLLDERAEILRQPQLGKNRLKIRRH